MRRKTILLVEDHDDSRYICSAILRHHGYGILEASDGPGGIQLAERHKPELIMMDVVLPVLDGWTVARRIREGDGTAGIPIVALTALAFRADRERGRRMGFAAYLVKPCSPSRVASVVHRIIGPALTS